MQRTMMVQAVGAIALWTAALAQAATITAAGPLSGANESPVNPSPGTGTALVSLDTTAHQLRVKVSFGGLAANTTAAHIHCCVAPPGNAGVATTTPAFAGFPLGVTSGTLDQVYDTTQASTWNAAYVTANGGTPAGAEAALANGLAAGTAYLNVHTSAYPAGEIRGFLAAGAPPPADSAIPTLSQWGLVAMGAGLLAVAWRTRRRRDA